MQFLSLGMHKQTNLISFLRDAQRYEVASRHMNADLILRNKRQEQTLVYGMDNKRMTYRTKVLR